MGEKLFALANLSPELWKIVWNGLNAWWDKVLINLTGGDSFIINTQKTYESIFNQALEEYLKSGDKSLLDRIVKDLTNQE